MPQSKKRIFIIRFSTFILSFLFCISIQTRSLAQYNLPQNYVWAFANHEGLNFIAGITPLPLPMTTSMGTSEGSASVSDDLGHLLFYSGGGMGIAGIYDRTGALMPHGTGITPFYIRSCTQAAAIVPVIGNPNQYYVFSLEQGGDVIWGVASGGFCHLVYCIVDMTLNGGLGDVIPSTIATPLDNGLSEKMTVVRGNGCNIWLLAHSKNDPYFKAYNISAAGISAPVVSTSTGELPSGTDAYKIGTIKASPDGTMIANCVTNGGYGGVLDRLELLQFDAATGIVSNCMVLNNFTYQSDAEFSPDNSKLYVHIFGSKVYQYDLSLLPSIFDVISSQFLVYTSPDWGGQMKLGPDGKIYLQTSVKYLDCINSPNMAGSSCSYSYHVVHLTGGAAYQNLGLPNIQVVANINDTVYSHTDTSVCALSATINAPAGSAWYLWSNGATTPTTTVTSSGIYWVKSAHDCHLQIDTFNVIITPSTLIPTVETAIFCAGLSATLTAPSGYTAHVWNTGATTSSVTATASGNYWVADADISSCILQIDTFHVTATPPALVPTVTTANFCFGSSVTLTAPASYTAHVWNTGATTASINVTAAGTYRVADTVFSTCTLYIDTFHVISTPLALVPTATTANFCIGSSATLTAPPSYTAHVWNTGATTSSVNVTAAGTYWVADTVFSTCILYTDTFHVTGTPFAFVPTVTHLGLCVGSSVTLTAPASYTTHVWSTGATTSSVTVTAAGNYRVADTNLSSCILQIDTFRVTSTPLAIVPVVTAASFCIGSSATLTAPASYTAHVWNTGATTSSIIITAAGNYRVVDTNLSSCVIQIDTFHVTATSPALVPTVTTTSFCIGTFATLTAPVSYTAFAWNTGATTSSINVTAPGVYRVADTVFSTCTLYIDTFYVTVTSLALVPTVTTTNFCVGSSATLSAPPGYTTHVWNTGAITSSIDVTTAGVYWVADTAISTCTLFIDTVHVTAVLLPVVALGNDTAICLGDSMVLSSPASEGSFLWSTGSTAFSIVVQATGFYYLTVTDQGCSMSDTLIISQSYLPSAIALGPDTILCKGEEFVLSSGSDPVLWNTGVMANSITVTRPGTYSATVTNVCGSSVSYINVGFEPCNLDFPNAFTPNNDGLNDIARAIGNLGAFRNYTLRIYNRFGQCVFYTNDIYAGWDGWFNEVPQELDTYFYMITYTIKGKHGMLKGDLTLVR